MDEISFVLRLVVEMTMAKWRGDAFDTLLVWLFTKKKNIR